MHFQILDAPYGASPNVVMPDRDFLLHLTEAGMRALVSDFYDLVKQSAIRDLFPRDDEAFESTKEHLADFFIQICGGPDYFNQRRGEPMMRKRHAPFRITPEARKVWLGCFIEALSKLALPEELLQSFWNYINVFSLWMVNSPSDHLST